MSTVDRNVFVSYSHADATWLERLKVHLRPLVRKGALNLWDDTRISPGQAWQEEVAEALARARVAVLLVSADFLASDFVVNNELPPLLHRAASGGVLILPVVIGPCLFWEHEELARYQCVNPPNKPLSQMANGSGVLGPKCRQVLPLSGVISEAIGWRIRTHPARCRGNATRSGRNYEEARTEYRRSRPA